MPEAPQLDVAVGVVSDVHGRVLLGQRPAGKPYAGWWEFPGGKLEAGESVARALARELHEELGIRVNHSTGWVMRRYEYPHARVRLWFRRVDARRGDWVGEAVGCEGQQLLWLDPHDLTDRPAGPVLPATLPALEWLRLPARLGGLSGPALLCGRDLAQVVARPAGRWLGALCANATELARAAALELDYVVVRASDGIPDWAQQTELPLYLGYAGAPTQRNANSQRLDRDDVTPLDQALDEVLEAARRAGANGIYDLGVCNADAAV